MAPITKKSGTSSKGKSKSKKIPSAPLAVKETKKTTKNPLFEKRPKNHRIGGNILPKRNLSRFVKWPKYINLQRQKRILLQRLKVPPTLNQFNFTLDKNMSSQLFRLLSKYKPETRPEKKQRLLEEANKQSKGNSPPTKKPIMIKYGLNHVTDLVEIKKAKLVVIAHDPEPLECVSWLPNLCRKKDIPFVIVKGKARLGSLVHKKTCLAVAVDNVRKEDQGEFDLLVKNFRALYNDNVELRRKWGGGIMGIKSQHVQQKKEKMIALEQAKKMGLAV